MSVVGDMLVIVTLEKGTPERTCFRIGGLPRDVNV